MRTILVTGFEPFGGEMVNASWEATRRLDGRRWDDCVAVACRLPCVYDECVLILSEALKRARPDALLMTGQAARRGVICVERFGRNAANARTPDNRGVIRPPEAPGYGPDEIETSAPAAAVARAIRAAGLPVRLSTHAGNYVCNHLYYGALSHLRAAAPQTPAIFLHLPATPEQTPPRASRGRLAAADAARALQAAAAALLQAQLPPLPLTGEGSGVSAALDAQSRRHSLIRRASPAVFSQREKGEESDSPSPPKWCKRARPDLERRSDASRVSVRRGARKER
ncbi:MAG: pyroglutamyl-peptidase I [Hyphomicrobiales bacterium]|nr:pyroglutamyl-peptidase I [Hyphomicrobiales bacterium]